MGFCEDCSLTIPVLICINQCTSHGKQSQCSQGSHLVSRPCVFQVTIKVTVVMVMLGWKNLVKFVTRKISSNCTTKSTCKFSENCFSYKNISYHPTGRPFVSYNYEINLPIL